MTYSFSIKAASKALAKAAVEEKLKTVVSDQDKHAKAAKSALRNANSVIDLLDNDDSKDVVVSVSGYISKQKIIGTPLSSVGISCSAGLADRIA